MNANDDLVSVLEQIKVDFKEVLNEAEKTIKAKDKRIKELERALRLLVDRDLRYSSGWLDTGLLRMSDINAARTTLEKKQ